MPLVTTNGFAPVPIQNFRTVSEDGVFPPLDDSKDLNIDIDNDFDIHKLAGHLDRISLIRIKFKTSADGRGFSLARQFRQLGYRGTLRASGHIICDQFGSAIACGFNEIEINDSLAERQPKDHWQCTARDDYRSRLYSQSKFQQLQDPHGSEIGTPEGVFATKVLEVEHYSSSLFRLSVTRPTSFRFSAGEFAMIALPDSSKPLYRAYSITTPDWADQLGFYSIKVPQGVFTSKFQWTRPGDTIWIKKKTTGSLVTHALNPGRRLFLISTGTGFAPFASLLFDPELYERFDEIVVTQTCRNSVELKFARQVIELAKSDSLIGDSARKRLRHFFSLTTERPQDTQIATGRITTLIEDGTLFRALDIEALDRSSDRVMLCGSIPALKDLRVLFEDRGFVAGSTNKPGDYLYERAFVQ